MRPCPLTRTLWLHTPCSELGLHTLCVLCQEQSFDVEGVALEEDGRHLRPRPLEFSTCSESQLPYQGHLGIAVLWD